MESWLAWARGPLFWAALAFLLLGLARHVFVVGWEVVRITRRAGDGRVPYRRLAKVTLAWLFPFGKLRNRALLGVTSLVFHIAIILVPLFLAGHIALWQRGLGLSWPAIPNALADVLAIVAVVGAALLVLQRAIAKDTRAVGRFQDYSLPLFIALPFAAGFLVMHPEWNPFPYELTLLVHVLSANVLLILIPVTKLSHAVLMPGSQLITEVAWHWPASAGSKVGITLGKEGEPV
jgi:nitrate reductase gamma subunit